jgi:predicted phage terminase large subunit-like protein
MQRLHENDMSGYLLAGGSDEEWEHLCLPAIDEDDESLWPEKHGIEKLKSMERADSYTFAGQYMQRPAPLGGGIFKDEWWQYWRELPKLSYRAIYVDTAQKTKEHNDFTVMQCWGKGKRGGAYLIDQIRGKWEAPELLTHARAFWAKHKSAYGLAALRSMEVEDKVSGTGLIQQLRREGIPVRAIQRDKDKLTRAMDVVPQVEVGNVYLPDGAPFLSDFLAESSAFPNGAHDDQLDPMMDAVDQILVNGGGGIAALAQW